MSNYGFFEIVKVGYPPKVICALKKQQLGRMSVVRQETIGGALKNAHLSYYLFKIWTIRHNFLIFDKLDILRYWLSAHKKLFVDNNG